jgi:cytochrome c-type biogenesis protein
MQEVSITIAFTAGLVSFLAPCVLPIIPGFLSYLAGSATETGEPPTRGQIFLTSVYFVLGFSSVFAALGVLLNTLLEAVAYSAQTWMSRIGGVIIILFGLYLTKLIRIPWLAKEHKLKVKRKFNSRYVTAFVFGAAFAAGWTPCVGAALGAILGLAASQPGAAFVLLMWYALGLGLPFLLIGAFTAQATKAIKRISPYLNTINVIFGVILIGLGVLIFTENLSRIANFEFLNRILLS